MNYETIKNQLSRGQIPPAILLYGEERYLIEILVQHLEKHILPEGRHPFCFHGFSEGDGEEEVKAAANTPPMTGRYKLIYGRDTGFFKGNRKREILLALLEDLPSFARLVFCESETDRNNPQFQWMTKQGMAYRIDLRNAKDLTDYIIARFRKHKKIISYENVRLFLHYSGEYLLDMESDIEKILLYLGESAHVKAEQIRNLCTGNRETRIYQLFDRICERKTGESLELLQKLAEIKLPVPIILTTLHGSYMDLIEAKRRRDLGVEYKSWRQGKPLPEFLQRKINQRAAIYTEGQLHDAVKLLSRCDVSIKNGLVNEDTAMEMLVISLAGL